MEINVTKKFIFSPILKLAIEEAKLSTYKQHKIAAVIFKGKRVIAIAHNAVRSNKIPYKFKNYLESSHAEAHAIIKARRNLKDYNILVVRINSNGELRMAKPCEFCQEFIDYVGIRNVYYSTNDANILQKGNE
jgi:tRNA(Arg) A34 adenosine deaminase TadA